MLPLQSDDLVPYPSDAARGEDTPRWRQSLELGIIKPLMLGGLLVWTPRRRDWAQDGHTAYPGAGEDEHDVAPDSRLIPTEAGWAEIDRVGARMMRAHWVIRTDVPSRTTTW